MADNSKELADKIVKDILINLETKGFSELEGLSDKANKALSKLDKTALSINNTLYKFKSTASNALAVFGISATIDKTATSALNYEKNIISLTSSFSKYGNGVKDVQKKIDSLSKSLAITREESAGLLKTFESNVTFGGLKNAENILKNIYNITGNNVSEMGNYLNVITEVANAYPGMIKDLERMSDADKKRLAAVANLRLMSGEMSLSQYKSLQNYLEQNKKLSAEEQKQMDRMKERQAVMGRFKALFEDISIKIGNQLLPIMEKIGQWLEKNENTVKSIVDNAVKLIPVLIAYKAAKGTIDLGKGLKEVSGSMGSIWGGKTGVSGMGGIGGAIGGSGSEDGKIKKYANATGKAVAGAMGGLIAQQGIKTGISSMGFNPESGLSKAGGIAGAAGVGAMMGGVPGAMVGATAGAVMEAIDTISYVKNTRESAVKAAESQGAGIKSKSEEEISGFRNKKGYSQSKVDVFAELSEAEATIGAGLAELNARIASGSKLGSSGRDLEQDMADRKLLLESLKEVQKQKQGKLSELVGERTSKLSKDNRARSAGGTEFIDYAFNKDNLGEDLEDIGSILTKMTTDLKYQTGYVSSIGSNFSTLTESSAYFSDNIAKSQTEAEELSKQLKIQETFLKNVAEVTKSNAKVVLEKNDEEKKSLNEQIKELEKQSSTTNDITQKSQMLLEIELKKKELIEKNQERVGLEADSKAKEIKANEEILRNQMAQKKIAEDKLKVFEMQLAIFQQQTTASSSLFQSQTEIALLMGGNVNFSKEVLGIEQNILKENEKRITLIQELDKSIAAQEKGSAKALELENKKKILQKELLDNQKNLLQLKKAEFEQNQKILQNQIALTNANNQFVDSLITKANTGGNVPRGEITSSIGKAISQVDTEKALYSKAISSGKDALSKGNEEDLARFYLQRAESKGEKLSGREAQEMAKKDLASGTGEWKIKLETEVIALQSEENNLLKRRGDIEAKALEINKMRLSVLEQETSLQEGLVGLADNFAIGIAASAKMRMEVVASLQEQQKIVKEQLAEAERQLIGDEKNLEKQSRLNELKQKELGITSSIAEKTKAMRDGWVSALSASTTGQGRIAKIMVDQSKNLGMSLKYLGQISSNVSGATSRGGQRVGETRSQSFQVGADGGVNITGGTGVGYTSDADKMLGLDTMGINQSIMGGQRGAVQGAFNNMVANKAAALKANGGAALGMSGAPFGAGAYMQGGTSSVGNLTGNGGGPTASSLVNSTTIPTSSGGPGMIQINIPVSVGSDTAQVVKTVMEKVSKELTKALTSGKDRN